MNLLNSIYHMAYTCEVSMHTMKKKPHAEHPITSLQTITKCILKDNR